MLRRFREILPTVDPSAYVDESAQVIGDVHIGPESSVWMNVVIRGDVNAIRIGARTNVQDGTVVHVQSGTHPTTIGDEVTIGHGAIVHGCTIEDRCLIGMGAILLNGVRVGTESIVAAGSLLPEGFQVPPRSLVMGSPAAGGAWRPRCDRRSRRTWTIDRRRAARGERARPACRLARHVLDASRPVRTARGGGAWRWISRISSSRRRGWAAASMRGRGPCDSAPMGVAGTPPWDPEISIATGAPVVTVAVSASRHAARAS